MSATTLDVIDQIPDASRSDLGLVDFNSTEAAVATTMLSPRFYTTDFKAMDAIDVESSIEEAIQLLIRSKDNIRSIAGDNGQDLLLSGEVDLALEYNGDILQVMEEDEDLSFAVPSQGTVLWEDVMGIPRNAPHPEEAHEFINFILEPEVHAAIADYVYYALPNAAAKRLMSEDYLNNPAIFPPEEVLDRSEVALYLGEDIVRLYEQLIPLAKRYREIDVPVEIVAGAQVVLGVTIGARFLGTPPREILRILALSVGSTVILLALTLAFAVVVGRVMGLGTVPLLLAYSPGGLAEMSLVAIAVQTEVAFVAAHHVIRIVIVMACAAPVFALLARGRWRP